MYTFALFFVMQSSVIFDIDEAKIIAVVRIGQIQNLYKKQRIKIQKHHKSFRASTGY